MRVSEYKHATDRVYPWSSTVDKALVKARYRVLWRIAGKAGLKVLDVGCGYGVQYEYLPENVYVVALDVDRESLRYVRDMTTCRTNIDIVQGSALKLPVRSRSVGVSLLMDVIEHVDKESAKKIIQELRRASKLLIAISTPNKLQGYRNPHHVHEYSVQELVRLVTKCGLQVVSVLGQVRSARLPMLSRLTSLMYSLVRRENTIIANVDEISRVLSEQDLVILARCEPYRPTITRDYAHIVLIAKV